MFPLTSINYDINLRQCGNILLPIKKFLNVKDCRKVVLGWMVEELQLTASSVPTLGQLEL